ncbi:TPA: MFS transporter [Acinetobacter baumannii]|uniref:MFS transporter n=1 Tax=Acinetobacter TaxID=469 RepID=UPI0015D32B9F|nr:MULTISPECIES: MFS transporter [Acinetobacter]MBE2342408.1 MFS transporter [Acinetobacter baumannii]MBE2346293.1 MFS transporter [Acinetobacter baumannii]MBE2549915.1 MFS transporter [Acinetobacter baumannii]HCW4237835.1 MFS transporter [Acinetobacter baumannii]HDJ7835920.1 MFS transporter [Acinetobacter baumannii]
MAITNTISKIGPNTWKIAFIFAFLALLVDGADLMLLSYSLNSIKAEFGLTPVEAGMLGSFTLAGMAIGGIYGGWACDKFGRVRTVVISILLFSVLTCGLGFTNSFWEFGILRFLAALGLGSLYIACNTLMAEYVPTQYRTTILGTLQAGWTVGYIVATLLAGWLIPDHGWRMLFYVAALPIGMAILMHYLVPEPAAWQENRHKKLEAEAIAKSESTWKMIFKDKRNRNMFILWALTAGFLQFGYYGVNNWMPSYLESELGMKFKEMTAYMVGTYTAMILGKVLAGYMADKMGRRFTYAFGAIGTAIFLPLIVFYNSPENILYLLVVFGFLYGIPYGVNATYMTESFPTSVRGTAIGGAYNVGRLGAAIAPAIIGYLATGGSIGMGFVVMGAAYFICGVIPSLFIKEKQYDPQKS